MNTVTGGPSTPACFHFIVFAIVSSMTHVALAQPALAIWGRRGPPKRVVGNKIEETKKVGIEGTDRPRRLWWSSPPLWRTARRRQSVFDVDGVRSMRSSSCPRRSCERTGCDRSDFVFFLQPARPHIDYEQKCVCHRITVLHHGSD